MAQINNSLVAPPPKHSMSVSVNVSAGFAQSTRSLGMYTAYYPSITATTELYTELQPGSQWNGSASGAVFVSTNKPLTFVGQIDPSTTASCTVNRMFFSDQAYTSWTLLNSTNDVATVFISSVATVASSGSQTPSAIKSVNNQFPDANGNVTVNTGVMTVDGVVPDSSGNVDTDETNY